MLRGDVDQQDLIITGNIHRWWSDPNKDDTDTEHVKSSGESLRGFSGEDLKNFHQRKRRGELLPFTHYTKTEYQESCTQSANVSDHDDQNSWGYSYTKLGAIHHIPENLRMRAVISRSPPIDTSMYVQAAAAAIYSVQRHDTLTALLELKKLRQMIMTAGRDLITLITSGKNLHQSWLSFRYGWRVLYYDLLAITKAIEAYGDDRERFSQRSGTSVSETITSEFIHSAASGTCSSTITDTYNFSVRGSVVAQIDPPKFSFNIAISAWEITPYSFIIDWFFKLGQWLASTSFLLFSEKHVAAGSVYTTLNRSISTDHTFGDSTHSGSYSLDLQSSGIHIVRNPASVSLLPQLDLNVDFDLYKFQDLLSLVARHLR